MDASRVVYIASAVFHVGLGAVLTFIETPPPQEITVVELQTIETPKKEEEEKKEEPPEPEPVPEQPRPEPKPQARAEAAATPEAPPDFGFVLGPGSDGPGGIAVPVAPKPAPVQKTARTLSAPVQTSECAEPETKAKPLSALKPAYTDAARAAGVEGKVRVEIFIDEQGQVTRVNVLKGLGHGLDEAAVAAVQSARFKPATRCGKAVASTLTAGITFTL